MRIVVPILVREYAETATAQPLVIAEALSAPYLSAAREDVDAALDLLVERITSSLQRAHPRLVRHLARGEAPEMTRRALPVYESAYYSWDEEQNLWVSTDRTCESEVDVLTWPRGENVEVALPLFQVGTVVAELDDSVIDELTRTTRAHSTRLEMHRPLPSSATVVLREIDFTPLDLAELGHADLWFAELEEVQQPQRTPMLEAVAQCWTRAARDEADRRGFVECFGYDATVTEIEELLGGRVPAPVVVIGQPRVGKTALIKHLVATRIRQQDARRREIWFADSPRLTSTDMASEWRAQCAQIVAELEEVDDILYLGRLVEALDAGKYFGSEYNLAQFLKPLLGDRRLRVISEATVEEWNDIERRDIGFARCFTVVRLEEPPQQQAQAIATSAIRRLAAAESVTVPDDAIDRAWALQRRFSTEGSTVGRTIDFVRQSVRMAANAYRPVVTQRDLVEAFCENTGLPPVLLLDDRRLDVEEVRRKLRERVLGQDEAIHHVGAMIGITKAGLASPDRPLGSFLFVGPTGVGKTELARALAAYLFGDDERMVRLDMSEYSHPDAYGRLIGEGSEDGDLTGPVRRQPFSLVLLDEIEKAHPSVFDLLLQVLGEARLTDVKGRTTTFRNAIVIMTSNLGVDGLRPVVGFVEQTHDSWAAHFRREAERFFRPEFLARIDEFIPFKPISREVVAAIARREVAQVLERDGLRSQDVAVRFDEAVYEWLAARGWDPRYGARPLKRVIEQQLVAELASRLAETRVASAEVTRVIHVGVEEGDPREAGLRWSIEQTRGANGEGTARRALLEQLERVALLRRRLQRYMVAMFPHLEWVVDNFDLAARSGQFWTERGASVHATEAEHARRAVTKANVLAAELAAMEDLANEAYHARAFELSDDIDEQLDDLNDRVYHSSVEIVRAVGIVPDDCTLMLTARHTDEAFRDQLVRWYRRLAEESGWKLTTWRPLPNFTLPEEHQWYDYERVSWERSSEVRGGVVMLEFKGYACRPLLRSEIGIHRLISADGNAACSVMEVDEEADWPWSPLVNVDDYRTTVRTYNQRTRELTLDNDAKVRLNYDYPFEGIKQLLFERTWDLIESDWV